MSDKDRDSRQQDTKSEDRESEDRAADDRDGDRRESEDRDGRQTGTEERGDDEPETEDGSDEELETEEGEAGDEEPGTEEREAGDEEAADAAESYDSELAPALWQRFDLLLAIGALAIFSAGTLYYRSLTAPSLRPFDHAGLGLEMPAGWLPAVEVESSPSALVSVAQTPTITGGQRRGNQTESARHEIYTSPRDPDLRVEVQVTRKPAFNNLRSALTLERVARYGGRYWAEDMGDRSIGGRDWLETRYKYGQRTSIGTAPSVSTAIEYAILNGNLLYVVTLHGDEGDVDKLEELVAPTLRVDPNAEEAN